MMSLAPVSVHQGRHYYKKDNYYTRDQDIINSSWFGRGAAELGLSGAVKGEVFDQLLMGVDPAGKVSLSGHHEPKLDHRRAAIDLTFSAPKSVSLAALVGGDVRLEMAHQRAVGRALGFAEDRYSMARSGGNQDRRTEVAGNFIVAQFQHDTSRAKDPQLHTHSVVINAVKRDDGKWRSLSNDALYANSKLIGLVYQNELAREVQSLGYTVAVKANGTFEIEGYSQEQLQGFSKRREQLHELGATTQREARDLVKINRPAKGEELPRAALKKRWQDEASSMAVNHPVAWKKYAEGRRHVDHGELVQAAARHATERDVSFRRETLERFALESGLGRIDLSELQRHMRQAVERQELIAHAPGQFTTRGALATEERMIILLREGKGRFDPIIRDVPRDIETNTKGFTLGQKAALEASLTSRDQFLAWQGVAGAGKTFAMNELRIVAEAQGLTVRGFAPSAEAAKVLETEGRLVTNTVAGLLMAKQPLHDLRRRELWIVDEAGLLSARDSAQLMERARNQGARVILVGDTRQLSSVEAGNPFKLLQQHGMTTAHMTESVRHKKAPDALKRATKSMADGAMRAGLALLEKYIVEYRRESTRVQHAAADFLALTPDERAKTLVLAGTNLERELLTDAIRSGLRAEGRLSGSVAVIQTLHSKDLTREETLAATKIEAGDILVFHKAYTRYGITKGMQLEVVSTDPAWRTLCARRADGAEVMLSAAQTSGFQVYESRSRDVAQGDLVRWTRNDRNLGLRNGQDLRVERMTAHQIGLTTKDGRLVEVSREQRMHLDFNYVNTVYASQGKTCERVIISADKTFGREAMYVAVTRAKSSVTLYTQDKERMCQLAEISRAKVSAVDLVERNMTVNRAQTPAKVGRVVRR